MLQNELFHSTNIGGLWFNQLEDNGLQVGDDLQEVLERFSEEFFEDDRGYWTLLSCRIFMPYGRTYYIYIFI